jgi:hypothetical protein
MGAGAVFNKHAETRALIIKMEETGEPFKSLSEDGKSFIAGAKDFPELEAVFDEFFEVTTKSCKGRSSAFVGMRMDSRMKMVKIKGIQKMFLWLRQQQIFLRPTKLEPVPASRVGLWKRLSPMDHSIGASEQKIKEALASAMSSRMETN